MKLNLSKQTTLKLLLFTALAANISWEPAFQALNKLDLASSDTTAANPLPTPPVVSKTDENVRPEKIVEKEFHTLTVCDEAYSVSYSEVEVNGKPAKTNIDIKKRFPEAAVANFTTNGDFAFNTSDETSKTQIEKHIESLILKSRHLDKDCKDETKVAKKNKHNSDKKKERKEHSTDYCATSKDSDDLNIVEKLHQVTVDEDADSRQERAESREQAFDEIESLIQDDLKPDLKKLLVSKDKELVAEGNDCADAAIEALKDVGTDLGLNKSKINRLANEIRAAKDATKISRRADKYKSDVDQLSKEYTEAWSQYMKTGDMRMISRLSGLNFQHNALNWDINNQLMQLDSLYNFGLIMPNEYNEYSSPYVQLKQSLMDVLNVNKSTSPVTANQILPTAGGTTTNYTLDSFSNPPSDIASKRSMFTQQFANKNGVMIPNQPATLGGSQVTNAPGPNGLTSTMTRPSLVAPFQNNGSTVLAPTSNRLTGFN